MVNFEPKHEIETRLINLLTNSEEVNISSLGGIEAVLAGWHSIARSKMADEFLLALVIDSTIDSLGSQNSVTALYNQTLRDNPDPLVIRNVALQIASNAPKLTGCFNTIFDLLTSKLSSFIRGQFLFAAFAIALLEKPKQYKLISFLLENGEGEEELFLQYQVKTIGLAYSFFANEDLLYQLEEFHAYLSDHDELYFELGMAYLKKGLASLEKKYTQECLLKAMGYFSSAEQLGRNDAACYYRLLSIITQFSIDEGQSSLNGRLQDLNIQLRRYAAYHLYRVEFGWANLRQKELMNWYQLSNKLTELSHHLGEKGWLNPILIIEDYLLQIYDAQRSILVHGCDSGVNLIIRPEVTRRMSRLSEKVNLLEQWMASALEHSAMPVAKQLLIEIEKYKAGLTLGNEFGTTSSRLIDVVPTVAKISPDDQNAFLRFAKQRLAQENLKKDKALEAIFCNVMDTFSKAGLDTDSEIWFGFQQIVFYTLFFLRERMDNTVKNFLRMGYLFDGENVKESTLQDDYYQNIAPLILNCNVVTEQMDIAGGRADVLFRFPDFFMVGEVKREKRKLTMKQIAEAYIGQTKEYQNTSAKLGTLLVLDLAAKPSGIGSIESNVKPFVINADENNQKRGILLVKIPGNRIKPSQMKYADKL